MAIQTFSESALKPNAKLIAGYFRTIEYSEHQGRMINECGQSMKTYPHYRMVTSPKLLPCRHRYCPTCQYWRTESLQQQVARFMEVVTSSGNTANWLLVTLYGQKSIVNCLKQRVDDMENAFRQLMNQRFAKHILGGIRLLEVAQDDEDNRSAIPRFHCLLLVTNTMFRGEDFINEAKWAEKWRNHLTVRDTPDVYQRRLEGDAGALTALVQKEISGSLNYFGDLPSASWFLEMARQMHGVPRIRVDGVLRPWCNGALEDQENDLIKERRDSMAKSQIHRIRDPGQKSTNERVRGSMNRKHGQSISLRSGHLPLGIEYSSFP